MVRRTFFLLLFLFGLSFQAQAHLHSYIGFGVNYASLGTVRVGLGDWEIGKYASRSIAINKLFRLSNSVYGALGAGLVGGSGGVVASFGYNWDLWLGIGIRLELYAEQSFDNYSQGAGLLGASFNF